MSITGFVQGWYVAYTRPNHEKKCSADLTRAGIRHFLPCVRKLRVWSDRRKFVDEPLLPSYVFVWLGDPIAYFSSLEVRGILYYVREGNRMATVNESVIDRLKRVIADERADLEVTSDQLLPGRVMVIKEGAFTGMPCEIVEHKGKQKILVRIELIQRNVLVNLPAEFLMPVPATFTI